MESELTSLDLVDDYAIKVRQDWYNRVYIAYQICNFSKNKEMSFLNSGYDRKGNIRYLNCGMIDFFFKYLKNFNFFTPKKNYNVYCSLATIDWANSSIKSFKFSGEERKEQTEEFNLQKDVFIDFSGFIDFDGDQDGENKLDISQEEAVSRALKDLKIVLDLFKKYKLTYWIQFSGKRGFHLFFQMPVEVSYGKKVSLANLIVKELSDILNLSTIDRLSYGRRKIAKTPYGLTTHNFKTHVVLPLDDEFINSFDLSKLRVEYVIKKMSLKNRGLLMRNENLSSSEKSSNFKAFLKDFDINIKDLQEIEE